LKTLLSRYLDKITADYFEAIAYPGAHGAEARINLGGRVRAEFD
jgi:hypothetical protein